MRRFDRALRMPGMMTTLVVAALYACPAWAYLDPGTGSVLMQGLIGAIAALAFTVKLYWHKFKALFKVKRPDSDAGSAMRAGTDEKQGQ